VGQTQASDARPIMFRPQQPLAQLHLVAPETAIVFGDAAAHGPPTRAWIPASSVVDVTFLQVGTEKAKGRGLADGGCTREHP
jgi:hypothetical protein